MLTAAWIFTDLTSSFDLILDTHGGEAFTAVSKLQVHPIHLLVNNAGESWYLRARGERALFTHAHANQHKKNQRICYVRIIYHCTLPHIPAALGNTLQAHNTVCESGMLVILWSSIMSTGAQFTIM